ncbi:MAG: TIM barrel protein [Gemmatimonadales bacterium]|nr:TIM barrel protein [Gemmatimonadales bacterium]
MKLSINSFVICTDWTLDALIEACRTGGYAGVEFRAESDQRHGVELEATPIQRREIRRKLEDAYLEAVCVSTSQCLHWHHEGTLRAHIERAKRYIDLAADIDCRAVRVFADGDPLPPDQDAREVCRRVGDALRGLADHAAGTPMTVLLEMHGCFNLWKYALDIVNQANHPNAALNYNCDSRDLVAGSVRETYSRIRGCLRHVHMHELELRDGDEAFPYLELFRLLQQDQYDGYCSLEIGYTGGRRR